MSETFPEKYALCQTGSSALWARVPACVAISLSYHQAVPEGREPHEFWLLSHPQGIISKSQAISCYVSSLYIQPQEAGGKKI